MSSFYPLGTSEAELKQYKQSILHNLKDAPEFIRPLRWLPPGVRSLVLDRALRRSFQSEQVTCQLKTVSEIIQDYNIQQIDLLKLDVEQSELDVLLGIAAKDWPKIKQVVAEVYDVEGRLDTILNLLKSHGLTQITLEQEPFRKNTRIYNLYALRERR
jgi:hypothetical protein